MPRFHETTNGEQAIDRQRARDDLIARALVVVEEHARERASATLTAERSDAMTVKISPVRQTAARIDIHFLDRDPSWVELELGEESGLCLQTDLYGERLRHWDEFLVGAVRTVILRGFDEIVTRSAGKIVKKSLELKLDDGTFEFHRTDVAASLRSLLSRKVTTRRSYSPY